MSDTAVWLEQFRGEPVSVWEGALAAQAREQATEDAADRREAAERAEAAESRAEGLALANRMLGNPVGEIASLRSALTTADDEVGELREKLVKAETRQARLRENLSWWSERWALAQEATSARSAPLRQDPVEAAFLRAQAAADDQRRRGAAVLEQARAQQAKRKRPRVSVRSALNGDGLPKASAPQSCVCGIPDCIAYPDDPDGAEHRSARARDQELIRRVDAGHSREVVRYGGHVVSVR